MALLEIQDIRKSFGGLQALDGVYLDVHKGEIRGLIGPNGSGKTTLFNVINGFYKPNGGTIHFRSQDITGMRPDRVAQEGLARTFQNALLFDEMTVLENIMVGLHRRSKAGTFSSIIRIPATRREEKWIRAEAVEILERIDLADQGNEMAKNLPYGKRRLTELGRALAMAPALIMLDEPTAGLNESESQTFIQLIRQLQEDGYTLLLVEHDMRVIMDVSDRVSVLDYGRKIAEGTPTEVQQNPKVIDAYLGVSGRRQLERLRQT